MPLFRVFMETHDPPCSPSTTWSHIVLQPVLKLMPMLSHSNCRPVKHSTKHICSAYMIQQLQRSRFSQFQQRATQAFQLLWLTDPSGKFLPPHGSTKQKQGMPLKVKHWPHTVTGWYRSDVLPNVNRENTPRNSWTKRERTQMNGNESPRTGRVAESKHWLYVSSSCFWHKQDLCNSTKLSCVNRLWQGFRDDSVDGAIIIKS